VSVEIVRRSSDVSVPAAPQGLFLLNSDYTYLEIMWDANTESDFNHYIIQKSLDLGLSYGFLESTQSTSFIDTDILQNSTYYYRLIAVDTSGRRSVPGTAISATVPIQVLLLSNMVVTPVQTSIDVSVTVDSPGGNLYIQATGTAVSVGVPYTPSVQQIVDGLNADDAAMPQGWHSVSDARAGVLPFPKTFNTTLTGFTPGTTRYVHAAQRNGLADSNVVSATYTLLTGVAATLSGSGARNIASTTMTAYVTTDQTSGTAYSTITGSPTQPTADQIIAGQDDTGAQMPSGFVRSNAVTAAGEQTFNHTGLTPGTTRYAHMVHRIGSLDSNILTAAFQMTLPATVVDVDWGFEADFSVDAGASPFYINSNSNPTLNGSTNSFDSSIKFAGTRSWGCNVNYSSDLTGYRNEVILNQAPIGAPEIALGTDVWIGYALYLPSSSWGAPKTVSGNYSYYFHQIHMPDGLPDSLASTCGLIFYDRTTAWGEGPHLGSFIIGRSGTTGGATRSTSFGPWTVPLDQWIGVVLNYKPHWDISQSPRTRLWINGGIGGNSSSPQVDDAGINCCNATGETRPYFKLGLYAWPFRSVSASNVVNGSCYCPRDSFKAVVGGTFSDVDPGIR